MRPLRMIATLMAVTLVSMPPSHAAAAGAGELDSQAIMAQQQEIRASASARRGRYRDMEEPRRRELFANQDTVTRLLAGTIRTTELSESDQIALFNSLEAISAIINQAEEQRMICERHKPVGTKLPQTVCKTVAQRRAEREAEAVRLRDNRCTDAWDSGACEN